MRSGAGGAANMSEQSGEVIGVGIDLVDVERIERMLADHGDAFLERVYTQGERAYCGLARNRTERLAARYAAKEALLKALGTGMRDGMAWTEIEVAHDPLGAPTMTLTGAVAAAAAARGVVRVAVSLTHAGGFAMAQVVLQGRKPLS